MEPVGTVNEYCEIEPGVKLTPQGPKKAPQARFHTVTLAAGVTPFIMFFDGKQCASNRHMLTVNRVMIAAAWYRPTKREFDSQDAEVKVHVLKGGLMPAALKLAAGRQLPDDPIPPAGDWEAIQSLFQEIYGVRLPPLAGKEVPNG